MSGLPLEILISTGHHTSCNLTEKARKHQKTTPKYHFKAASTKAISQPLITLVYFKKSSLGSSKNKLIHKLSVPLQDKMTIFGEVHNLPLWVDLKIKQKDFLKKGVGWKRKQHLNRK